ncbi:MAG: hypothetical protein AB7Q01_14065 [Gammaproteobacteria bacterium]
MGAPQRVERLEPYLRPNQINELVEERNGIEATLTGPDHVRNVVQDRAAMVRQIRAIDRQLAENAPKPYAETEIDNAARREAELRERLTSTMLTQAELRRNPVGAADKLRGWERTYKQDVLEWKNLRLRLHASGHIDDVPDAQDVANLERFRPAYSPNELNMRGEQIQGKQFFMPQGPIEIKNVMSEEERAAMAERDALAAENARLKAELAAREKADADAAAANAVRAALPGGKK